MESRVIGVTQLVTEIINTSFREIFNSSLKQAAVLLTQKQSTLDASDLVSYCSVAKLPFLSKLIETLAASNYKLM